MYGQSLLRLSVRRHRKQKPFIKDNQIIVNVGKGIEENTLMTLCEILEDELPMADVCVLSGPSHAEEVSHGVPTTVVVGAKTEKRRQCLYRMCL